MSKHSDRALCLYRSGFEFEIQTSNLEAESVVKIEKNAYRKKKFFLLNRKKHQEHYEMTEMEI